jgi:hypothetical protein
MRMREAVGSLLLNVKVLRIRMWIGWLESLLGFRHGHCVLQVVLISKEKEFGGILNSW